MFLLCRTALFSVSVPFSPPSVSSLCHQNLLMLDAQWIFNTFLLNVCVCAKSFSRTLKRTD